MWRILKQHRLDPAPLRSSVSWTQFLRSQAAVTCDFITVDTALLRRCYLLFFIGLLHRMMILGWRCVRRVGVGVRCQLGRRRMMSQRSVLHTRQMGAIVSPGFAHWRQKTAQPLASVWVRSHSISTSRCRK